MRGYLSQPIDFGWRLPDKQPLFGRSKTWRGAIAAVLCTAVAAAALGYPVQTGALVALYALAGDLLSSFVKRRLGIPPHGMAPLLDQVPESLLPAIMLQATFGLDAVSIVILVCVFVIVGLLLSAILYKLGIRKTPY